MLTMQLFLSDGALRRGQRRWPLRPKHHFAKHLVQQAFRSKRNPKYRGCMQDEDFLGKVARLGKDLNRRCIMVHIIKRFRLRLARHCLHTSNFHGAM